MPVENPMTITPLTTRLIKIEFAGDVAVTAAAQSTDSYAITNGVEVQQVVTDPDADSLSSVNLIISRPSLGEEYQVSATGLILASNGNLIDTSDGKFTATKTKTDSMISNLSGMYDVSYNSILFHVLAAVGLADEEIGGKSTISLPVTGLILPPAEATYGTATYGTGTYGG